MSGGSIEAEVERALAPYRGLLPPEALAAFRERWMPAG